MKSKTLNKLRKQFLKSSPHQKVLNLNKILSPFNQLDLTDFPSNEQHIKKFLTHIECTYMYDYFGPPIANNYSMVGRNITIKNSCVDGFVRIKHTANGKINKNLLIKDFIKCLQSQEQVNINYNQLQQCLQELTLQQTKLFKQNVLLLYGMLIGQKLKFNLNTYQHSYCNDIEQLIFKKISLTGEQQSCELIQTVKQQAFVLQNLQNARKNQQKGQINAAKRQYQIVYVSKLSNQKQKIEALQFLCHQSLINNDKQYLNQILCDVMQNGKQNHGKIIQFALDKIQLLKDATFQTSEADQIVHNTVLNVNSIQITEANSQENLQ